MLSCITCLDFLVLVVFSLRLDSIDLSEHMHVCFDLGLPLIIVVVVQSPLHAENIKNLYETDAFLSALLF